MVKLESSRRRYKVSPEAALLVDNMEGVDTRNLKLIIILSGKRKSGKDHVSRMILDHIGAPNSSRVALLRIAGPIKEQFSKDNKLDFSKLLDSSEYKEHHRGAMVEWSERRRSQQGWNCFLEQSIREQSSPHNFIWILNDARRPCDLEFFEMQQSLRVNQVHIVKLRIEASDEVRATRGWKFTKGIDDQPTECALDSYKDWTFVVTNNSSDQSVIIESLSPVITLIDSALSAATRECNE